MMAKTPLLTYVIKKIHYSRDVPRSYESGGLHKGILNMRNLVIFSICSNSIYGSLYSLCFVKLLARLSIFSHPDILVLVSR